MSKEPIDSAKIAKIYARTTPGEEQIPQSWLRLASDIYTFATSCSTLLLVSGEAGSGKTTFMKIVQNQSPNDLDIIPVTPAYPSPKPDWLMEAIAPWITSDKRSASSTSEKLKSLAETPRPILLCIDTALSGDEGNTAQAVTALLNLADSSNLRLSVLIASTPEYKTALIAQSNLAQRTAINVDLPLFNETEIRNFTFKKLQASDINTDCILPESMLKICKESRGMPGILIQHLAKSLSGNNKSKSDNSMTSKPQKIITEQPQKKSDHDKENKKLHRIEDLLAPRKN